MKAGYCLVYHCAIAHFLYSAATCRLWCHVLQELATHVHMHEYMHVYMCMYGTGVGGICVPNAKADGIFHSHCVMLCTCFAVSLY